jgi:tRNA(Ile)-lysidine synthase
MLSSLQSILQHNCHIGINKPVVIGVSGGPDSLCLLDLLWRLNYPLIVGHLDHGLRPEAKEEARRVEYEADSRKLPFVLQELDIQAFAEENKLSVEEAARAARYKFLFDQARSYSAQAVAVGHNADDQVETVLMHLLRGSGLAGLAGMDYSQVIKEFDESIPLIRPLLGFWRQEIISYISEHKLVPAIDETNWDQRYYRNRLRHGLLPLLESYNPQVRRTIYRMADILRGEQEIIEDVIDRVHETVLVEQGNDYVILSADELQSQPVGSQRRVLRRGIDHLRPGLRDVDFDAVERGLSLLQVGGSTKTELVAGLAAILEENYIILASKDAELPTEAWPQVPRGLEYQLGVPGECLLPEGWRLRSELVRDVSGIIDIVQNNTDPFRTWINIDEITLPFIVRGRHPGDRFNPLGMEGHTVKLSDFMINNKIPSRARDGWPLIVSGSEIIWVAGCRPAHHTRMQPGVHQAAYLKLVRISDQ